MIEVCACFDLCAHNGTYVIKHMDEGDAQKQELLPIIRRTIRLKIDKFRHTTRAQDHQLCSLSQTITLNPRIKTYGMIYDFKDKDIQT